MSRAASVQTVSRPAQNVQALGYFALDDQQKRVADVHYRTLGNNPTPSQIELFELDKHNYEFSQPFFDKLPKAGAEYFRKLYLRQYKRHLKGDSIAHASGNVARREANLYLRNVLMPRVNNVLAQYTHIVAITDPSRVFYYLESLERPSGENGFLKSNRKPLYLYTKKEIDQLFALPLAGYCAQKITEFGEQHQGKVEDTDAAMLVFFKMIYRKIGTLCADLWLPLPNWEKFKAGKITLQNIETDLSKACDQAYWSRILDRAKVRMAEHIAIATGQVNKHSSPYVSAVAFEQHKEKRKKNWDFIANQILINIDDPEEQIELQQTFLKSHANEEIRRGEMMNEVRGMEEYADANGHISLFLTLTAPSSYHAYHSKGGFNAKWLGASPRATQKYLCKVWAKMRASWARAGISYYGVRVVEPHHDGTPHWHVLVFLPPEHEKKFSEIFRRYALEQDGDEKGAAEHRCKIEKIDRSKGSAVGYISKYISKNINGRKLKGEIDHETGRPLSESASKVRAWASLWGIRQFQFIGVPPISVWRELRRLGDRVIEGDDELDTLRAVCDVGDFACYIREQGGTELKRADLLARVRYIEDGENAYHEVRKKIDGVYNQSNPLSEVRTRLKKWKIMKKPSDWGNPADERSEAVKNSGLCPPWTCVNNCTGQKMNNFNSFDPPTEIDEEIPINSGQFLGKMQRLKIDLYRKGEEISIEDQKTLLFGGKVRLKNGEFLQLDGQRLRIERGC